VEWRGEYFDDRLLALYGDEQRCLLDIDGEVFTSVFTLHLDRDVDVADCLGPMVREGGLRVCLFCCSYGVLTPLDDGFFLLSGWFCGKLD